MRQTARAPGQLDVFMLGDLADFRGDGMDARRTESFAARRDVGPGQRLLQGINSGHQMSPATKPAMTKM